MHEKITVKPYIIGFALSLILTFVAYFLVELRNLVPVTTEVIIAVILILAVMQLLVQLFFFLHMGQEKKPHWNLVAFITFISLILLIVVSSLWIMHHLNYNMMPKDMEKKILHNELMEGPGFSSEEKQKEIEEHR
jgi:cytochrome o ubiquinol oxidase subunit IV